MGRFDLSLTAFTEPPPAEPLVPPPTPKETIEQVLIAARLADTADRAAGASRDGADRPRSRRGRAACRLAGGDARRHEGAVRDRASRGPRLSVVDRSHHRSGRSPRKGGRRSRPRAARRSGAPQRSGARRPAARNRRCADRGRGSAPRRGPPASAGAGSLGAARAGVPAVSRGDPGSPGSVCHVGARRFSRSSCWPAALRRASCGSSARSRRFCEQARTISPPEEFRSTHALLVSAVQLAGKRRPDPARGDACRGYRARVGRLVGRRRRAHARRPRQNGYAEPASSAATPVITPRRTRLVRVPDLHAFRHAIVGLSLAGDAERLASRVVLVPTRGAARQLRRTIGSDGAGPRDARGVLRSPSRAAGQPARPSDRVRPRRDGAVGRTRSVGRSLGEAWRLRPGPHRRDAALLRSAAAPGAERRTLRGTARRGVARRTRSTTAGRSGCSLRRAFWRRHFVDTSVACRRRARVTSTCSANC